MRSIGWLCFVWLLICLAPFVDYSREEDEED